MAQNKKRSVVGGVLVFAIACFGQGCGGSDDDDAGANASNVTNASSGKSGQAGAAAGEKAAPPPDGSGFAPREAIVLEDVQFEDDGSEVSRARILLSNSTGLCDRIDDMLLMKKGEAVISLWMDGKTFSTGKQTLDKGATSKKAGASYLDSKNVCGESTEDVDRGAGTYEITAAGATVKGKLDLVFRGGHVTTTFEAKACAKKTHGRAACEGDRDAPVPTADDTPSR